MYDASNRKDIRRAEKAAEALEQQRINYLVSSMSIPQGRAWFWDFLESCHIFSDPFTGDALREAYQKGERNVGLRIYADIVTQCPQYFTLMAKEAHDRHIERTSRDSRYAAASRKHSGSSDADRGIEELSAAFADDGIDTAED